ncbi:hypothetical protein [Microbacterium sp. NC79]|uniref:hypothetical protein n=1 Tax=Microbacterium sp. NC79 TaxID=2851009 RepID=UPI001C2C98B9|nr:hypothetical protein [Microbacterium sp. NC79]MBV0894232.1 hypothetical protein [Microbacterium sp. NC79]
MKTWVVRFGSLYVFNVVVLWLIGALIPRVYVGWSALWGAVILTAATIFVKPAVTKFLKNATSNSSKSMSAGVQKAIEYGIVFVVALVVWILVRIFSGVYTWDFFTGILLPPVVLLAAWFIYDMIDDRIEKVAGDLYDKAESAVNEKNAGAQPASPSPESPATRAARDELKDGLTPEQRRMMEDL